MLCEFSGMILDFFGFFCNFRNSLQLIINHFRLLKIIRNIGKYRNYGKNSNLVIYEFLKIDWNICGNFIVENELFSNIGNY